jgi:hypothetical protein
VSDLTRWVDARIQQVRADAVRSYLLKHSWKSRPYSRPELWVFEGPADDRGQPIVQVLPSSEHLADYQPRLGELLASLAVIEDRRAGEILDDILRERITQPTAPTNGPGRMAK